MKFDILFGIRGGKLLDSFDEGVEFGFRNLNHGREWIPLTFYSFRRTPRDDDIKLGSELMPGDFVNMRGHSVFYSLVSGTVTHNAQLKLCGNEIMQNNASLNFRWLQTVVISHAENADVAYLDNVIISINSPREHGLFNDDFNSGIMIK